MAEDSLEAKIARLEARIDILVEDSKNTRKNIHDLRDDIFTPIGVIQTQVAVLKNEMEILLGNGQPGEVAKIRVRMGEILDRLGEIDGHIELLDDRTDVHQKAISKLESSQRSLESFQRNHNADHLAEKKAEMAKIAINARWIKGIAWIVGLLAGAEGDHLSGGNLIKWIGSWFTGPKP
jgi:chromosome segregation ATPase